MIQNKADYLAEWLREEWSRGRGYGGTSAHQKGETVWGFIAENLPEAEEAFNSVMEDHRYE